MKTNIQNAILIVLVSIFILGTLWYAFNRFYIEKDYLVTQQISCDPETENCFVWQCDPTTETCSENEDDNIAYYKIIEKRAFNIPECTDEEDCEELHCEANEVDCAVTLCMNDASEGETSEAVCSDDMNMTEEPEKTEEEVAETEATDEEAVE